MVDREKVIACYRLLLDREPESEEAIEAKCNAPSERSVIEDILHGSEFLNLHKAEIERSLNSKD